MYWCTYLSNGYFRKYQDVLPPVYISGCGNSCGVHQIGAIGLVGKKAKVDGTLKGVFEVFMNGNHEEDYKRILKIKRCHLTKNLEDVFFICAEVDEIVDYGNLVFKMAYPFLMT